jgi:hypothetical protein
MYLSRSVGCGLADVMSVLTAIPWFMALFVLEGMKCLIDGKVILGLLKYTVSFYWIM